MINLITLVQSVEYNLLQMDLIYQFWMVVVEELGILYARSVLVKIKLD